MRPCNSGYDKRIGGAIKDLITALREAGHTVDCPVTGSVIVDGEECDKDAFEGSAIAWDGTEDGLEDLGW